MLGKTLGVRALSLYTEIDIAIEKHYKSKAKKAPCAKGCASCCSQFFEISELEFALMYETIKTYPLEKQTLLAEKAQIWISVFEDKWPDFYKEFFSSADKAFDEDHYYKHPERFKVHLPCIFLSDEGACEIYERRPLVCRTTGVGYKHNLNFGAICNEIRWGFLSRFWQADLRPFKSAIEAVSWLPPETGDYFDSKRQYPIFYYVYDALVKNPPEVYDAILNRYML